MMNNGSIFGLFAIVPILLYLIILVFAIYFVVRTIRFMSEKTKLDQERNQKLDALINAIQENNRKNN
ncbi:hypothetical protein [Neobacillus mesonae]|uniref:hypothetical protein n=1 Tax=Neobacillus mesonae TaxID=1193713 RepID=UPI00203F3139|nr:hypothetical protein [Neobacillus mesonae]MCM3569155.1 hypothetical protein [Neobacillus mesonae]